MPLKAPGEGRREEFDRVALPHLDRVYGAALYLTGDRDRADDVVQETFLRAYRFFHRFERGTNCKAWLLTILHNTFRNSYRAALRERGNVDIDSPAAAVEARLAADPADDPAAAVLAGLLDEEIAAALASLPEEFRAAVVLVDLEEMTYEESARILGCPIGTVRSRLSRARRLLRAQLAAYAEARGYRRSGGGDLR